MFFIFLLLIAAGAGIFVFYITKKSASAPTDASSQSDNPANKKQPDNKALKASITDALRPFLDKIGIIGLSVDDSGETSQQFMPFDKIEDSMICITDVRGYKYYRMLLECNSINYSLKTDQEKDIVDAQFMNAITGWNFPWGIYIQTRTLDNRGFIQQTRNDVNNISMKYPALAEYGEAYYNFINDTMSSQKTKLLVKKKYIIVTCNEANTMDELDDEDKQDWAFEKLYSRCQLIQSSLSKMGISSHICRNAEISAVIFQAFNKKDGGAADGVVSSDFLTGTVTGKEATKDYNPNDLHQMIEDFVKQIDVKIMESPNASFDERAKARKVQQRASELIDALKD